MKLKNIFIGLTCCAALSLTTSCTNLDETVYDALTDQSIDTEDENVVGFMMGEALANFRYIYWTWNGYFDLQEECGDLYCTPKRIGVGWGDLYINMHKHNWTSNQEHPYNLWYNGYVCIGYCNQCLDVLPEEKAYERAQMRFLRAQVYYMLFDAFRNVPIETTQQVEAGYLPQQNTAEEVFNFVVSEMEAIKQDLGTDHVFGYANRFAADMTLAKLYLNYNAYFDASGNEYYQKALAEVNDVIDNGGYSLAAHYEDNFKADISGSPEVIFAIPLDSKHASHNYNVNKCLVGAGAAAYGYSGSPWNGSCAIPQFIDTYDPEDKRFDLTWAHDIQYAAVKNADGTYTPQAGDPIPFSNDDWSGTGYLNYSKMVHSIDNPGAYMQEGYRFVKNEIVPEDKGTYGDDVAFYRLADAMFIKAECLLRISTANDEEAARLISEVRARAFDSSSKAKRNAGQLRAGSVYAYGHDEYTGEGVTNWGSHVFTSEGGDDIELGGLLDDLAWEFVGEHHRRQDLIRFKMADGRNVFNGKSWFCKDATTETHWNYFPIPKDARDANQSLVQNQGYTD